MVSRKQGKVTRYIVSVLVTCFTIYHLPFTIYCSFADESKFQPSGPFNIRNMMPMYMFYMQMAPEKAETTQKGRYSLDAGYHVANTIIKQHDPWPSWKPYNDLTYDLLIDTEVSRFYADIKYGLLDNLEVSVNIPLLDYSGGYLDSFIENFEDVFEAIKTPNAREDRPGDKYRFKVVHFGQTVIDDLSEPSGIGEITLEAKYKVLEEKDYLPTISLRGGLKLPTASDEILGSDEIDYGVGVLLDKKLMDRLFLYINLNVIFIGKPDIIDKLNIDDYILSGLFGLEFFLTDRTSIILQAFGNTTIYDEGISAMDKDGAVLSVGFNHNFTKDISWQIAMDENTNNATPDFGLLTSLKIRI
ncbi:MAG: DUF3187 family protein [Candidatus Omnitrophica bacterium]|nr:DUF3187 family protein [Candidatus Omnitrophota bacterium]